MSLVWYSLGTITAIMISGKKKKITFWLHRPCWADCPTCKHPRGRLISFYGNLFTSLLDVFGQDDSDEKYFWYHELSHNSGVLLKYELVDYSMNIQPTQHSQREMFTHQQTQLQVRYDRNGCSLYFIYRMTNVIAEKSRGINGFISMFIIIFTSPSHLSLCCGTGGTQQS